MTIKTLFDTTKKKLIWLAVGGTAFAAGTQMLPEQQEAIKPLSSYEKLEWAKPTTDSQWAEDNKKESLNFKTDEELVQMKASLEDSFTGANKEAYDKATQYPDVLKYELVKQGFTDPELTNELNSQIASAGWQYEKVSQSLDRVNKEIELRSKKKVDRTDDIISTQPSTDHEREVIKQLKKQKGLQ